MRVKRFFALPTLLLLVLFAGCATTRGAEATGDEVLVRVENNLIPPTSLTVSAVSEIGGTSQLLGTVAPSETTTLRLDPSAVSGRYFFVATTTAGAEIPSNPISLVDAEMVTWDVTGNLVTVTEEEPE